MAPGSPPDDPVRGLAPCFISPRLLQSGGSFCLTLPAASDAPVRGARFGPGQSSPGANVVLHSARVAPIRGVFLSYLPVASDNDGEEEEYTAERILSDKPDPSTPGTRLYKVRWKGSAAWRDSGEPPNSCVPRYTSVWLEYLEANKIKLDVKDVLVHLVVGDQD